MRIAREAFKPLVIDVDGSLPILFAGEPLGPPIVEDVRQFGLPLWMAQEICTCVNGRQGLVVFFARCQIVHEAADLIFCNLADLANIFESGELLLQKHLEFGRTLAFCCGLCPSWTQ